MYKDADINPSHKDFTPFFDLWWIVKNMNYFTFLKFFPSSYHYSYFSFSIKMLKVTLESNDLY